MLKHVKKKKTLHAPRIQSVYKHIKTHSPPWPVESDKPHTAEEASAVPAVESPVLQPELSSQQPPGPGTESE